MTVTDLYWCISCMAIIVIVSAFIPSIYRRITRFYIRSKVKDHIRKYPEMHQRGMLSVETKIESIHDCDFGVMIAEDGRVWICVDGIAFIRFRPIHNMKET